MNPTIWTPQLIIFLSVLAMFFLVTLVALVKYGTKEAINVMKTFLAINSAILGAGITYFFTQSRVSEAEASKAAMNMVAQQARSEVARLDGELRSQAAKQNELEGQTTALREALDRSLEFVPAAQKKVLMPQVKPLLDEKGSLAAPEGWK